MGSTNAGEGRKGYSVLYYHQHYPMTACWLWGSLLLTQLSLLNLFDSYNVPRQVGMQAE